MVAMDEFLHRKGTDLFWGESYYFDFCGSELQGFVRLGFHPNQDKVNTWVYLMDDTNYYWVRKEDIQPRDTHGLSVDTDNIDLILEPVNLGEKWNIEFNGKLTKSGSPMEVLNEDGKEISGLLDLEVCGHSPVFYYSKGKHWIPRENTNRYEQACRYTGEIDIDESVFELSEVAGERDHSWGKRKWTQIVYMWASGGFSDGSAYNLLWFHGMGEPLINGFWFDGEEQHPIEDLSVDSSIEFGWETTKQWSRDNPPTIDVSLEYKDGLVDFMVEPVKTTPLEFQEGEDRCILNRSPCELMRRDGVEGMGFTENNQIPEK